MITVPMTVASDSAPVPMAVVSDSASVPMDVSLVENVPIIEALTNSGNTVHAPQGYYPSALSKYIPWDYRGEDVEQLSTYSYDYTLADTTYSSWTPSTTAKAILSGVNAETLNIDTSQYEYLIRWQTEFIAQYKSGATKKIIPKKEVCELWQVICRRPSDRANVITGAFNGNACLSYFTAPICEYYNSGGNLVTAFTASYGIYPGATTATFGSSTNTSTTLTVKTPSINARCSNTYMSTARAAEIDTTSTFKTRGWLYRVKKGGAVENMYQNVVSLFNNALT